MMGRQKDKKKKTEQFSSHPLSPPKTPTILLCLSKKQIQKQAGTLTSLKTNFWFSGILWIFS